MAQRASRKRRRRRRGSKAARSTAGRAAATGENGGTTPDGAGVDGGRGTMAGGYGRSRAKDAAARAALKPLAAGERPTAVTVGAIVAAIAAGANALAMAAGFDAGEGGRNVSTAAGTAILVVVAVGMWRARYWAVLGMQTLLALTMIIGSLALLTAVNLAAAVLVVAIVAAAGTLFWFLVKAMARIQMPSSSAGERR